MALINCPECQTEISDKTTACPKCGNPMTPAVPLSIDLGLGESQLMEKYRISFNGDQYDHQGFRYSRFDDALTFAKSQVEKPNPEHIADSPPPKEKSSGTWWKVLLAILGIVVLLVVIDKNRPPPTYTQINGDWVPEGSSGPSEYDVKQRSRGAINLCWEEQQRKSLDPATARFAASACERMESDFLSKYGHKP